MKNDELDRSYINKVLTGDDHAFGYFITTYKDMAFTIAISVLKNETVSEEVVQDSFLKAFNGLHKFKFESKFSTWFYRITLNEAMYRMKRMNKEIIDFYPHYDGDTIDESQIYKIEESEQSKLINQAMKILSPSESLVMRLFYLEEENIETVSDITGISSGNIKVILHRARKNMFKIINQLNPQKL